MNHNLFVYTFALSLSLLHGCSNSGNNQVWTSKSESLLGAASEMPSINPGEMLPPVSDPEALRQTALTVLIKAADSTNAMLRANAIEALHSAPDQIEPMVQRGLGDENRGVRFVAAMTVGKLQLRSIAPLVEPLLHDESASVQAAAIYALRRCERKADLNPLAEMLRSENPEVKGNAALVLGELGEPSAISLLRHAVGKGMMRVAASRRKVVELQMAEAMVKLGASSQIEVIRAALFAPSEEGDLTALACQMCGELKDGGSLPDLQNLIRRSGRSARPAEIRMAATQAIGEIDPDKAPVDVPSAYITNSRYELRAQAAHALGAICSGGKDHPNAIAALPYLAKLIDDPNPLVQIAAAGGVLRLQQPHLSASR